MARNVEIKASLRDVKSFENKARALSKREPQIINQEDYFFHCNNGRLKLRFISKQLGMLIFYNRANKSSPQPSEYFISQTNNPKNLLTVLEKSYGIAGVIKKTRKLYLVGRTRIHIDYVQDLGEFMELEVVLGEDEKTSIGADEAEKLMKQLGIEKSHLIDCAYIDLLNAHDL